MIGLLKLLDPERAHGIAKWAMKHRLLAPGKMKAGSGPYVFDTRLLNPFGLAAGFDKNGELVDVIEDYGFGFMEVGSITFRGGPGNPKPRLFRLENGDILNRMGLNGEPAQIVAPRLLRAKSTRFGVNIAKTHDPEIVGDKAIDDIVGSYKLLNRCGFYTALNVSCPNTREGKTFEQPEALRDLLDEVGHHRLGAAPLLVKFSPTLVMEADLSRLESLVATCEYHNINGYVCCNTLPWEHAKYGKGGRSGSAVAPYTQQLVGVMRRRTTKTLIACGGIRDAEDARVMRRCGADLFEVYNGFVSSPLAGPRFARKINAEYERLATCNT